MSRKMLVEDEEILEVINSISSISKKKRRIVLDMDDHFRRIHLHYEKIFKLRKILSHIIKKQTWEKEEDIFILIDQLIKEVNLETGVINNAAYEGTEFVALEKKEKKLEIKEGQLTFSLYDRLNELNLKTSKNAGKKIEKIKTELAKAKKDLAFSLDIHLEQILNILAGLLNLQQETAALEIKILLEIKTFKGKPLNEKNQEKLEYLSKRLFKQSRFSRKIQYKIKTEFYRPFQKFLGKKFAALERVKKILAGKRLFNRSERITLKDVKLDFNTLISSTEVQQYFGILRKREVRKFVDSEVFTWIDEVGEKAANKAEIMEERTKVAFFEKSKDPHSGALRKETMYNYFAILKDKFDREDSPFSIIMLDIDYFKQFNDTFGHEAGDTAIRAVAGTIINIKRRRDIFIRYGGEEFIIFLPNTKKEDAWSAAERYRLAVEKNKDPNGKPITISLGIATYPKDSGKEITVNQFVEMADQALYQAKKAGRNKSIMYQKS